MLSSLSRRDVVVGFSTTAVATAFPFGAARATAGSLNFLTISDWGRDGASHQRDVAVQMGKAADANDSRFVVAVGDNFYDNGVQTAQHSQWKSSFEDVYTAPALQNPWYALLGNVAEDAGASVYRTTVPREASARAQAA